jgi:putative copper resistance protein D
MLPDIVSVAIRAIGFVLLFQAIGAAFFAALFPEAVQSAAAIRRITIVSAGGGIAAAAVHWALEATRMTGDFAGVLDTTMQHRVIDSSFSTAHALPMLGLSLIAAATCRRARLSTPVACVGGAIAVAGFAFVGHVSADAWRALLGPLLIVHLLIVAFWFGALLPLWTVIRRESVNVAASVVQTFSELATWLVPIIAIAGAIMMLLIARGVPSFDEPYGALIAAKIGGFILLMGLAALNKWKWAPSLAKAAGQSAALRRSVLGEYALIVAVLGVTAIMTAFYSPNE